jgi:hypothetical protein
MAFETFFYVNQYIFLVILRPVSLDSMPIVLIATLAGGHRWLSTLSHREKVYPVSAQIVLCRVS